jgi:ubiquinone/menaquinone biosynthesis C-methylase UbiE
MENNITDIKGKAELEYWIDRKKIEKELSNYNTHYNYFYTDFFDLDYDFYSNSKVLDIGCGPRGSLEWANNTKERVGLDPLADEYLKLGANKQQMKYISSGSENIPFEDNYFDVVCSFNSLDHVDNLEETILEIIRVLKKGGTFLLISDVNHDPTPCEPIFFSFDIVDQFKKDFKLISEKHFEKFEKGCYQSIESNIKYDHTNSDKRYGIVTAKFRK